MTGRDEARIFNFDLCLEISKIKNLNICRKSFLKFSRARKIKFFQNKLREFSDA